MCYVSDCISFLAKRNAAIYYIHGGVHQSLDFSKRYLREMAKWTGATVIAPDNRREPSSKLKFRHKAFATESICMP